MQIGQRLFLHENSLSHNVGRIRLLDDFFANKGLGVRITRLMLRLFQAVENACDGKVFVLVHMCLPCPQYAVGIRGSHLDCTNERLTGLALIGTKLKR